MKIEKIVSIEAFKDIWFTWNNELNHEEAEEIYDAFQTEIQYEVDKLLHTFYAKRKAERLFQEVIELRREKI